MNKIINTEEAINIAKKLREQNKSIVLAGGCFDLIHAGHIVFLEKAKKYADSLFVLLESDQSVKNKKGNNRPVNNQKARAIVLSALSVVDFIVMLRGVTRNEEYDKIVSAIKPLYLATTTNDHYVYHKKRQAKQIGAKVVYATKRIYNKSTTKLAKLVNGQSL